MNLIDISKDLTIVVQGPLNHHGSSTYELVNNLIKYIPRSNIIMSIPKDEIIEDKRLLDFQVVRYQTFDPYIDATRNHYIRNMVSGVKIGLQKVKTDFAMRIRTDHRDFRIKPEIQFPIDKLVNDFFIGVASFGTHHRANGQFRIGCVSDHIHIGKTSNLLTYWEWDQYSEEYVAIRNLFPWGFQPSYYKYYMEQILYFSWRNRYGISKVIKAPSRNVWEKEFNKYFGIINSKAISFNLNTHLGNWKKFSKDGDFLIVSSPNKLHFNLRQYKSSVLDSFDRWIPFIEKNLCLNKLNSTGDRNRNIL